MFNINTCQHLKLVSLYCADGDNVVVMFRNGARLRWSWCIAQCTLSSIKPLSRLAHDDFDCLFMRLR